MNFSIVAADHTATWFNKSVADPNIFQTRKLKLIYAQIISSVSLRGIYQYHPNGGL